MKRKAIIICSALLSMLILAGCNADSPIKSVSETVKIELFVAETDETVVLTETEAVRRICDNLASLKLRKMEGHTDPTVLVYTLKFYGAQGEQLEAVDIPADDWIVRYNDGVYSIAEGGLDRGYLNEIVDQDRTVS